MRFDVAGRSTYAYTGARAPVDNGAAVLFVHGAANDHSVWSLQSRYFAYHGRNVLAVDLPGHGRSAGAPLGSVEAIADWLAVASDAARAPRYSLVGHSMGALACLEHAARYPERVERVALLGAAVPMAVGDALLDAAGRDDPSAYEMITSWSHSPPQQLGGNRLPGVWLSGQTLRLMERSARGVLDADLRACRSYANGLAAAAAVSCPAMVLVGERDLMAPPRTSLALAAALSNVTRVSLPNTGHAMMSEQPDAVLDTLRDFLRPSA
jgi:pimeloyl-ACP methyl ester carboxylesterase